MKYFERGAGAMVDRNRWFLVSILLIVLCVMNAVGWYIALPLKTVEAYAVNKEPSGRLVTDSEPVGKWAPDKDSIEYFLNQWATNLYSVNKNDLEKTYTAATELAIGEATAQMKDFRAKDNPWANIQNNMSYSRTYEFITMNWIEENVALIRFKTTTRKNNEVPLVITHAMKVSFERIKPTTRQQVMKNPAGLYITSFDPTEESRYQK